MGKRCPSIVGGAASMDRIIILDVRWGETIYSRVQRSGWRHVASVASLCVDEAVWFPLSLLLCMLNMAVGAVTPEIQSWLFRGVPLEIFVDIFNNAVTLSCAAGLMKL